MLQLSSYRTPLIVLSTTLFAFFTCAASALNQGSPTIEGLWATEGFGSIVDIYPCEEEIETICGRIVWLWASVDKNGQQRTDRKNPDRDLRSLPLVGTEILREFSPIADNEWGRGRLYNPDDGRTYGGSIRLSEDGHLKLEGCALNLFCRTQTWYRPNAIIDMAMAEAR